MLLFAIRGPNNWSRHIDKSILAEQILKESPPTSMRDILSKQFLRALRLALGGCFLQQLIAEKDNSPSIRYADQSPC
jgi:hypothetical protein